MIPCVVTKLKILIYDKLQYEKCDTLYGSTWYIVALNLLILLYIFARFRLTTYFVIGIVIVIVIVLAPNVYMILVCIPFLFSFSVLFYFHMGLWMLHVSFYSYIVFSVRQCAISHLLHSVFLRFILSRLWKHAAQ